MKVPCRLFIYAEKSTKSADIISPGMGETFYVDLGEFLLFKVEFSEIQTYANSAFDQARGW